MTLIRIVIKDPAHIPDVLDIIHDNWFDVQDIVFDPESSLLSFGFRREAQDKSRVIKKIGPLRKLEVPIVEWFLKFHHVKRYTINDTEHVGTYDFTSLEYDPELNRISVTTGIPIDIQLFVEQFEVSVEESDRVVRVKTATSIFGL